MAQPLTSSLFIVTSTKAINIEFEKFRRQKKQQGVEAHPHAIAKMFAHTMSCPEIQKSVNSFVNTTSVKMKAEARQRHHLEGVVVEDDATSDPHLTSYSLSLESGLQDQFHMNYRRRILRERNRDPPTSRVLSLIITSIQSSS